MTVLHPRRPGECARLRARRRTLLIGCALGSVLALSTAAGRADAQAFNANPTTAFGAVVYDRATPGVETVQIESDTAVIDWRPPSDPGPEFLFLPDGNVATFQNGPNNSDFVVLNRIVTTVPSRFDGTVLSRLNALSGGTSPGGTVLFSGPGGIIVGAGAVFDVGNLVLTSLDVVVDGAGNFITADGGFQFVDGDLRPNTAVVTEAGSQIFASPEGSYIAFVAPRIVHGGSVTVNGSAGYIAGEQAEFSVSQGLFDIIVPVGSDNANPIVHTGSTGGSASTGGTDNHRIYMVAVPKNQAITALLSGEVGFDAATDVTVENGAIILSAGYNRIFSGDFVETSSPSAQDASFLITGGTVTSDLTGFAVTDMFASGEAASLEFQQDVRLFGGERARLFAANGETVSVGGDALVSADRFTSSDPSPDVTGGEALASAGSGGTLVVSGDLQITASGYGTSTAIEFGDGTGGTASLVADDGEVRVTGNVLVVANGAGEASPYAGVDAGQGIGGTASVAASGTGLIVLSGDLGVQADGNGGDVQLVAAPPGAGSGGNAGIQALEDGAVAVAGNVVLSAVGTAGVFDSGDASLVDPVDGAAGLGGTAGAATDGSGEIVIDGNLTLDVSGLGSDGELGGAGGAGTGGEASVSVQGGNLAAASLQITASGQGGSAGDALENTDGTPEVGGIGGEGRGGTAAIAVGPDGTLTVDLATLDATGTGGAGGDGSSLSGPGGEGGSGGSGQGGSAIVGTTGGSVVVTSSAGIDLVSSGIGGASGAGGAAPGTQPGGDGGAGGAGAGGSSAVDVAGGSVTTDFTDLDSAGLGGAGGAGGANFTQPGSAGAGGSGTGGIARITVADAGFPGEASLGVATLSANAVGGSGSAGPGDVAGRILVQDLGTVAGGLSFASLTASSTGAPAAGGPAFDLTSDQGPINVAGDVTIDVAGDVGFTAAGSGGLDAAGAVSVLAGGSILLDHDAPAGDVPTVSAAAVSMQAGAAIEGTAQTLIQADDGDVMLAAASVDTGRVTATADVLVDAGAIALDEVAAGRDVLLAAGGDIDVGLARAGDDFRAAAGGAFTGGTLAATGLGPDSDGDGGTPPDGSNIIVAADGDIAVGEARAEGAIRLAAAGDLDAGTLNALGPVEADAGGAAIIAEARSSESVAVDAGGDLRLDDGSADTTLALTSSGGSIASDGLLNAGTDLDVSAPGDVVLNDATAGGALTIDAGGDLGAGLLAAGGPVDADAGGAATIVSAFSAASIDVAAGGELRLDDADSGGAIRLASSGGSVASDGLLDAGADLAVSASADIAVNDANAEDGIAFEAGGNVDADTISALGAIDVEAGGTAAIATAAGTGAIRVDAGGDLRLDQGSTFGRIDLASATGNIASAGLLTGNSGLGLSAAGDISVNQAVSAAAIDIAAGGDLGAASLAASGPIALASGGSAAIASAETFASLTLAAGGAADLGAISAAQDVSVTAAGISLDTVTAGRDVSLASSAGIDVGTAEAGDDFVAVAAGAFAADRVDATGAGPDSESGSEAQRGSGNIAVAAGGDLRLDNGDAALDLSLASTTGSISSAGTLSSGRAFEATADGDFAMGDAAVLSAETIDVAAAGDATFNLVAAQTFTAAAGGVANFLGNVDAETIDVTSADIEIASGGSLGADITQSVTLTALETGQPAVVGGTGQGPGYTLTDTEANRIITALLRLRAPPAGTDPGRGPDLVVGGLTLTGERIGRLELLTPGILEVGGALLLADVRTDGGILLRGGERLQIVTPDGSVRVRDGADMPAGALTLESNHIWSASRSLLDQLAANPDFTGRNDALLANGGPVEPRGYIEAGDVTLRAGQTLFVQNSGDATGFAGITVVGDTLTIIPAGDTPLVVYAFGRRLNPDGSFVTNDQFFAEVVFEGRGGAIGYTDESEFNRCVINTGICPAAAPEPGIAIPDGPDIIEQPVGGQFALTVPPLGGDELIDTSFSAEPVVEQPVTSGGDSILWDCDMDGDGDCDEDD